MKILIVSATTFEVAPLFGKLNTSFNDNSNFISTTHHKHTIDFLITGVGMVATSYQTTKALIHKQYDLAINIGICGTFNKNLELGTVVNIYQDCFSELGAEDGEIFVTLEELHLKGQTAIINETTISNAVINEIPKVTGITVNTAHGNEQSIEKVFDKFHPYVESMEGAAFMFVCQNEQVPYIQIRAVSNLVEQRNKNNWNIPLAIENLNKKVLEILDALD
jgi:futalosine hydrolase